MSTPMTDPPKRAPMRRWLRVVLFVSLALNLLVIGLAIGAMVRFGPWRGDLRMDRIAGSYVFALERDDRRAIGREMMRHWRQSPDPRSAYRAEFAKVLSTLRAEPFDAGALADILDRQLDFGREKVELGQRLLIERIAAMTPKQRAAYASRLEDGLKRHRHKGDKEGRRDRDREDDRDAGREGRGWWGKDQ